MRRLLPILALAGFVIALVVVLAGRSEPLVPPTDAPAPVSYAQQVAGLGIVESASREVNIGTPVSDIVTLLAVKPGDHVQAGDVLARLDDRDARARLTSALAQVREAQSLLTRARHDLEPVEALVKQQLLGEVELTRRQDDIAVARAGVAVACARVGELEAEIERRTIRAPRAGLVLRVNVRPGELAATDPAAAPLLVLGDDHDLLVRVEVDERDASRVLPGASAVAMPRGNARVRWPLQFVRIEPYVTAKSVLAGRSGERTDVRVLQVLFALASTDQAVYVGQELDVLIETGDRAQAK